jgi:predicted DNA-binding antitoxin AbrB/MazE fold protein
MKPKQKIYLKESDLHKIIKHVINEELTRSQVQDEIDDFAKSKDFEKRVHNIVVDAMNELVHNLWNKKSFWSNMLKKK